MPYGAGMSSRITQGQAVELRKDVSHDDAFSGGRLVVHVVNRSSDRLALGGVAGTLFISTAATIAGLPRNVMRLLRNI